MSRGKTVSAPSPDAAFDETLLVATDLTNIYALRSALQEFDRCCAEGSRSGAQEDYAVADNRIALKLALDGVRRAAKRLFP